MGRAGARIDTSFNGLVAGRVRRSACIAPSVAPHRLRPHGCDGWSRIDVDDGPRWLRGWSAHYTDLVFALVMWRRLSK